MYGKANPYFLGLAGLVAFYAVFFRLSLSRFQIDIKKFLMPLDQISIDYKHSLLIGAIWLGFSVGFLSAKDCVKGFNCF